MKNRSRSGISFRMIAVLVVIAVGVVFFFTHRQSRPDTSEGIAYIQNQNQKSVDEISEHIYQRKEQEIIDQTETALQDPDTNVYNLFNDFVMFGDSRVYGYITTGALDPSRVLADGGATIHNIPDYLSVIEQLRPKNIFLSYGVNDMGLEIGSEEGGYGAQYEAEIQKILEIVPGANIYVNSIIPAQPFRVETSPSWGNVDAYNAEIKKMCKRNKWHYIDNDPLADGGNANIYQEDGVHFLFDFYPVWARHMLEATIS